MLRFSKSLFPRLGIAVSLLGEFANSFVGYFTLFLMPERSAWSVKLVIATFDWFPI